MLRITMSEKKLQILDIGAGPKSVAVDVFQPVIDQGYEYELVTIDINPENNPTYVLDIREPLPPELVGRFDLVLASHVFEHIERHVAMIAFNNMASTLAKGGELWVAVPSLEWCADQVYNGQPNVAVYLCLYGGGTPNMPSTFYHNMAYTLPVLRDVFCKAGLVVRKAYQAPLELPFTSSTGEERLYHALQNIVIGVQPNDPVAVIG